MRRVEKQIPHVQEIYHVLIGYWGIPGDLIPCWQQSHLALPATLVVW